MTYKPIPEHRRRELAPLTAELTSKFKSRLGAPATGEPERDFWQRVDAPGVSPDELVWLIRHAKVGAGGIDPVQITNYTWPARCELTGPKATREGWPLEPIPGEPQAAPKGPLVDGTPVKEGDVLYYVGDYKPSHGAEIVWLRVSDLSRTKPVIIEGRVVKPGDVLYYKLDADTILAGQERTIERTDSAGLWFTDGCMRALEELTEMTYVKPEKVRVTDRIVFDPAVLSTSITKEKPTMNQTAQQATPLNHASLSVDASKIVEVKTFVYGTDIATLNDDDLLNHVERLTGAIEHLELLNTRTPLAKLVTKIAQLKDAKAKIVNLLGGAPVQADSDMADSIVITRSYGDANVQPRKRRTKAEMDADNAKAVSAAPVPPAPPAPTQPEPSVADVDLDD